MELALELDADDLASDEDGHEIFTSPENYIAVREAVAARGFDPAACEVSMIPQSYVDLSEDHVQTVLKLIESLEELDDIQNVWTNVNVDTALAGAN